MITALLFGVFGVAAVAAGVAVFVTDSMARASYALAVSFVAVGGIALLLNLSYIGPIIVLMMVMEMAIMAVFMVMLMGMNPALMPMDMTHSKRSSVVLSAAVFVLLAAVALLVPWPVRESLRLPGGDTIAALGQSIMGSKMLVMLTISPVLFATMVTAVVLANPRSRYERLGDDLDRERPADPERGGLQR
ncbi:NADH-quinone oxidoreductase subunit J [Amnibacterium endophyticum]|uniref:NADH-quinone oxidoreductase subunit J n=1 Tax=Amnibacterium endophyticum TaxID=2109337 RepID=A0ABW4LG38_9MICO